MDAVSPDRVTVTPAAAQLLRQLVAEHGEILLVQAGGCCDGSAPICVRRDEFPLGGTDVHVADLEVGDGSPLVVGLWQSEHQFRYSRHLHLTIDAEPGYGAEFSLESARDMRFLVRSRLLDAGADTDPALDVAGQVPAQVHYRAAPRS